jgi:tRNA uridine 5-carbamoylmethylation protein Kti12
MNLQKLLEQLSKIENEIHLIKEEIIIQISEMEEMTIEIPKKSKNISKKQKLHNEAIASLAERREHDRIRALKLFAHELEDLEELEKKLNKS